MKLGGGANDWLPGDPHGDASSASGEPPAWVGALSSFLSTEGDPAVKARLAAVLSASVLASGVDESGSRGKACFTTCCEDDEVKIEDVGRGEAKITAVAVVS